MIFFLKLRKLSKNEKVLLVLISFMLLLHRHFLMNCYFIFIFSEFANGEWSSKKDLGQSSKSIGHISGRTRTTKKSAGRHCKAVRWSFAHLRNSTQWTYCSAQYLIAMSCHDRSWHILSWCIKSYYDKIMSHDDNSCPVMTCHGHVKLNT